MSPAQVRRNLGGEAATAQIFAKFEVLRIETNNGKGGNSRK